MRKVLFTIVLFTVLLSGCVTTPPPATPAPAPAATAAESATAAPEPAPTASGTVLTVMTHDSFSVSEAVVAEFQAQCACTVQFLKSGDAGLALNRAILSKANPLADVFYGVDNTFLSRALTNDIFEPYASPALAGIPAELKLDASNSLLPVDYGYVALNYDKALFTEKGLAVPGSLRELTDPKYKGLLVVENPASSSPGMAFLLATIAAFGETGDYTYLDFWRDLRGNDVFVAEGWEDAYYGQFSGGAAEGSHPIVVSYATSPAAEVFFADPQPADSPTANLMPANSAFRQVEFVGILKGARQPELARKWVDFMLGEAFQTDIPLQMWVYPARQGTTLPDVFMRFAQVPAEPAQMAPERIEAGREAWLQAWTDAVLR